MKQVFSILSEQAGDRSGQVLAIRIGEKHFGFSITNPAAGELYKLAWYSDAEMNENALRELYLQHPELRDSFLKTQLCYDHPQSVLVPDPLSESSDSPAVLLEAMYGVNGKDRLVAESVDNWHLQNIYRVPAEIYDWAESHFPTAQSWHAYTIGLKHVEMTDFEGSLALDFRPDDFSLIVSRANKLLLAQTFSYATPADVIYYLLNICREFSFTQDAVRVNLSGLVDRESALFRELYSYFVHIRFREPDWVLASGEAEYPAHFFTSLNDLALCAS